MVSGTLVFERGDPETSTRTGLSSDRHLATARLQARTDRLFLPRCMSPLRNTRSPPVAELNLGNRAHRRKGSDGRRVRAFGDFDECCRRTRTLAQPRCAMVARQNIGVAVGAGWLVLVPRGVVLGAAGEPNDRALGPHPPPPDGNPGVGTLSRGAGEGDTALKGWVGEGNIEPRVRRIRAPSPRRSPRSGRWFPFPRRSGPGRRWRQRATSCLRRSSASRCAA